MPRGWTENLGGGLKARGVILLGFKKKMQRRLHTKEDECLAHFCPGNHKSDFSPQKTGELPRSGPSTDPELPLHFRIQGSIQKRGQLNKTHHHLQGLVHKCSLFSWQWQTATANTRYGCFMPSHFTAALPWQPAWTWRASRFISKWVFC